MTINSNESYGWTCREVIHILGICDRSLRKLVADDKIPHYRVGRLIKFPKRRLEAWMDNGGTDQRRADGKQ